MMNYSLVVNWLHEVRRFFIHHHLPSTDCGKTNSAVQFSCNFSCVTFIGFTSFIFLNYLLTYANLKPVNLLPNHKFT